MSNQNRKGIEPFKEKVWLSSPTMHGDEQKYVDEAIRTNWVSTVGEKHQPSRKTNRRKNWMQLCRSSICWYSSPSFSDEALC